MRRGSAALRDSVSVVVLLVVVATVAAVAPSAALRQVQFLIDCHQLLQYPP